jgi:hypothetical protein
LTNNECIDVRASIEIGFVIVKHCRGLPAFFFFSQPKLFQNEKQTARALPIEPCHGVIGAMAMAIADCHCHILNMFLCPLLIESLTKSNARERQARLHLVQTVSKVSSLIGLLIHVNHLRTIIDDIFCEFFFLFLLCIINISFVFNDLSIRHRKRYERLINQF